MIAPQRQVDEAAVLDVLARTAARADPGRIREILTRARELKGLAPDDVATLCAIREPQRAEELFEAARVVKQAVYGKRIVLFAPLYISSECVNECRYCAFRAGNRKVQRRRLSQDEIADEIRALIDAGQKRVLLVAGETPSDMELDFILESIKTIYGTCSARGNIRRVNVNLAPLSVGQFRRLKDAGIGTYQLFQETYHRATYAQVHPAGPKAHYEARLAAIDHAMQAGLDDVGLGVLFGLYDWRFEVQALMQHIRHLEERFGVGPHTLSVPRLEAASGSALAGNPPARVTDFDFKKIIAILRLAAPYTGIILSTRESPPMRHAAVELGVSQMSAGSRTTPGGYARQGLETGQFALGDARSLEQVICDLIEMGHLPSFCTACYRLGRTGRDFMDLAKPGLIKKHCEPNGVASFMEYLVHFASEPTRAAGKRLIEKIVTEAEGTQRATLLRMLRQAEEGRRDVFI